MTEARRLPGSLRIPCAGYGIGLKRKAYLPQFLDEAQLDLMRRVKAAFDPKGILNPGKLVYRENEEGRREA